MTTTTIIGLGNYDPRKSGGGYSNSRHNYGFILLEQLRTSWQGTAWRNWRQHAWISEARIPIGERQAQPPNKRLADVRDEQILLVKPKSFMNLSGPIVRQVCDYWRVAATRMLLAHDDLDLPFGSYKFSTGRGSGGHRGVADVIAKLGVTDFWRLRLGIGKPLTPVNGATLTREQRHSWLRHYVLADFTKDERQQVTRICMFLADQLPLALLPPSESSKTSNKIGSSSENRLLNRLTSGFSKTSVKAAASVLKRASGKTAAEKSGHGVAPLLSNSSLDSLRLRWQQRDA